MYMYYRPVCTKMVGNAESQLVSSAQGNDCILVKMGTDRDVDSNIKWAGLALTKMYMIVQFSLSLTSTPPGW